MRGRRGTFAHPSEGAAYPASFECVHGGHSLHPKRAPLEGSYQHLDSVVVDFLQGRQGVEPSVRAILDTHGAEQIKAVLLNEGERYRRFNRMRFANLVEELRLRGVLW